MTDFKRLLSGGESEGVAIAPGHPDKSAILKMITPQDGEVRMPKGKTPLNEIEIALLTAWIQQGATDDTPADARKHYDAEHPPVYSRPPVVSSIDFSPDGKLLAITGFHEVLLYDAAGSNLVAPWLGRVSACNPSNFPPIPNGSPPLVGIRQRAGEVQVWDVEKRKLSVSAPSPMTRLQRSSVGLPTANSSPSAAQITPSALWRQVQENKCCRWALQ